MGVKAIQELTPEQVNKLYFLNAQGKTVNQIARALKIGFSVVSKNLRNQPTGNLISIVAEEFYKETLGKSAENFIGVIGNSKKKLSHQQYDASKRVLESTGILNTNSQSIYIQNVYTQNNLVLSPVVQEMLDFHLNKLLEYNPKEVEEKCQ